MEEKEFKNLEDLKNNRVFYHFLEISKIPHKSFEEKKLSDYIKTWAENLNLEVSQDKLNNLLIRKNASSGRENEPAVIVQAHLDMVCEKDPNYEHDFSSDAIPVELNGDILSTGNKTTLGADDGIGVALAMALLEDNSLSHPPLDIIFTTAEEEDLSGAIGVDKSWFRTNQVINIDHIAEDEIVMGSCGGKGVELTIPVSYEEIQKGKHFYELKVTGLLGGHSGEDIDKGLGNAIVILGRLLDELRLKISFNLCKIEGGNFRLAIPRESSALVAIDFSEEEIFYNIVESFNKSFSSVYKSTAKDFKIEVSTSSELKNAFSSDSQNKVIDAILLSPNGVNDFLADLQVVESSCNLGELHTNEDNVKLVTEIRATFEENREFIYRKIELLAKILGANIEDFAAYPSWNFKPNSKMSNVLRDSHKSLYGEDMKILVVHAGLECGCFAPKIPNMDAISIGPNAQGLHSPFEKLSVSSTLKVHQLLIEFLKNI
ncbi:MAG: aminoacyl-histidine dipeptidase [Tissierellia bacterium]|nr:aminoacyl-histidine dipeptidase [Tissierellia bacterium]